MIFVLPPEIFFTVVNYIVVVSGVLLNLLLLYTILAKTPKALRSFSILLMNACLTDLVQCCVEGFAMMRISSIGNSIIFVPKGVCNYFGKQACVAGFALTMHGFCNIFFSNTACFVFRYVILTRAELITVRNVVRASIILYLPAILVFFLCEYAVNSSSVEFIDEITRDLPYKGNYHVFGVENYLTPAPLAYLFLSVFSSPIHYAVMIYIRSMVYHLLDSNQKISSATKQGHMQLMKAVTFQACLPPITISAIGTFGLMQLGLLRSAFVEQILFAWGVSACAIAPCLHIYFVRPYREAVKKMFGFGRKSVEKKTKTVEGSGVHNIYVVSTNNAAFES